MSSLHYRIRSRRVVDLRGMGRESIWAGGRVCVRVTEDQAVLLIGHAAVVDMILVVVAVVVVT